MIRKKMAAAAILTLALCLGGCGSSYNAASSNETGSSYAAEEAGQRRAGLRAAGTGRTEDRLQS